MRETQDDAQVLAPLVPADVDLTDFEFMPLSVIKLRDSGLASDEPPEVCWAAVLLWCAAWHQVPAASIPDNDQWQAKHAGYKSRGRIDPAWSKVREGALRNFVKCADGRLYHTTVAKKALEAWESKLRYAYGKMGDRLRKANKVRTDSGLEPIGLPTFEDWISAGKVDPLPLEIRKKAAGKKPEKALKEKRGQEKKGEERTGEEGRGNEGAGASGATPDGAADTKAVRGERLPKDWKLPKPWGLWALEKYPYWTEDIVRELADKFRNHWVAKSGKGAAMLDWYATWQNWCMNGIAQKDYPKPASFARANGDGQEELARALRARRGEKEAAIESTQGVIDV